MGKKRSRRRGSKTRTAVDLAAAGIGIASLVLDALNQHRDGKVKKEAREQEALAADAGDPRADEARSTPGQEAVQPLHRPDADQAAANGGDRPPGRLAQTLGAAAGLGASGGVGRAVRAADAALDTA
jgi:hypothetical protein